jgi:hypothetical protein
VPDESSPHTSSFLEVTNYLLGAENSTVAVTQEFSNVLLNPRFHYRVHKSSPLVKPVHTIPSYLCKINLMLSPLLCLGLPNLYAFFSPQLLLYFSPFHPSWLGHSNLTEPHIIQFLSNFVLFRLSLVKNRPPLWSEFQATGQRCIVFPVRYELNVYILCRRSRPSLWSSGLSSWLQNGDVLCYLWGTNWIYICYVEDIDRLSGLVVRVPGYRTKMYCVSCEVRTEFIYVM